MRVCVLLVAVAFGVLAVPALARAAPGASTTQQLLQQADAAMNDAQALAAQGVTATSSGASAAMARPPASVPANVASVQSEATKAVSAAIATAAASGAAAPPPPVAVQSPMSRRTSDPHRYRPATPARHRAARNGSASRGGRAAVGTSTVGPIGSALPVTPRHAVSRAHDSPRRNRSAGAAPHRPPPLPAPPQGLSGGAEATGSGSPTPLLVAALGTALFVIIFQLLSRLLPRSAFRKPRRLALPPWHPG